MKQFTLFAVLAVVLLGSVDSQADEYCRPGFFLCNDGNCRDFDYEVGDTITEFGKGLTVLQDSDSEFLVNAGFDEVIHNLNAESRCEVKRPSYNGGTYDTSLKPDYCAALADDSLVGAVIGGLIVGAITVFTGGFGLAALGTAVGTTGVIGAGAAIGGTVTAVTSDSLQSCLDKPRSVTLQDTSDE